MKLSLRLGTVICHWQMAPQGELSHIITMPHVTKDERLLMGKIEEPY